MNSERYQAILEQFLLSFRDRWPSLEHVFQQDNASVHVLASTRTWLEAKKLPILSWPAKSLDLSPIENAWSQLVRHVYRDGRQFNNVIELKKAISEEWDKIDQTYLANLIGTMNKRLIEVISNRGDVTHY